MPQIILGVESLLRAYSSHAQAHVSGCVYICFYHTNMGVFCALIFFGFFSWFFMQWEPSKFELVTNHMVEQYFSKLDDEGWEELKLPARSNLPATAIAKL